MIKSLVSVYCNLRFHAAEAEIIRHNDSGRFEQQKQKLPYRNEKSRDSDSGLVQQLPLSVTAAAEDLAPQVEGGGGGGEHDEKLLLQTEAAHSRGRVVAARPGEDLPGDGVGGAPVLQLVDVGGQPGLVCLVFVPEVASVASVPLLEGALCEASVLLLLLRDQVSDTGAVDHPLGQAVALHWT